MLCWCYGGASQVMRAGAGGDMRMRWLDKTSPPTQWTRVCANSGDSEGQGRRTWLQFTRSWRAGHDLATEPPPLPRRLGGRESTCPHRQDPQETWVWPLRVRMTSSGNSSVFQGDSINISNNCLQFLHLLPEIKRLMSEGFYPFWQF